MDVHFSLQEVIIVLNILSLPFLSSFWNSYNADIVSFDSTL